MPSDRSKAWPHRIFLWAAATCLAGVIAFGTYMGAYCAMLHPDGAGIAAGLTPSDGWPTPPDGWPTHVELHPSYRTESEWVRAVFRPAHHVDRLVRHDRWFVDLSHRGP